MKSDNIDALTGLRGLAAWMVVLYHFREYTPRFMGGAASLLIDHGYLAVDLFFILSGLVLYINYHHQFESVQARVATSFYFRRIARIYPLHLAVLVLYLANPIAIALFSSAGDPGSRYSLEYFLLSVFLIQNWGFTASVEWNIPAWSISTEFAAYLLFPILVCAIKRGAGRASWMPMATYLGLLIAIPALYIGNGLPSLGENISRLGIARCILEFSMGLVLGYHYVLNPAWLARQARYFLAAFCVVGVALLLIGGAPDYFAAPLLFTLLILSLLDARAPWSRFFAWRPLVYLGEISYSTYMIHYFVKDWIKFLSSEIGLTQYVVYVAVVFVLSMLLYRWVEYPFRTRLYAVLSGRVGSPKIAQ